MNIIDDPTITIQDVSTKDEVGQSSIQKLTSTNVRSYYYEWNQKDGKWNKLLNTDPEPPSDAPTGTFDGQIYEVRNVI